MKRRHENRDGFIDCVDTVSSKDGCIKFQVQMFDYEDPKKGATIVLDVICAQWDTSIPGCGARRITPETESFTGDLEYETEYPASERKTAEDNFKDLCDEFDPDLNQDLADPNGKPEDLLEQE